MVDHFNRLTPAQAERLAVLFEEMAEATQVVGKVLRHGLASTNPHDPTGESNRFLLERELGHVLHALERLTSEGDLSRGNVNLAQRYKARTIRRWLHHQPDAPGHQPNTPRNPMVNESIARVVHEAIIAYAREVGHDAPLPHWDQLSDDYRESTIDGVQKARDGATPRSLHDAWMKERLAAGWVHGPRLNRDAKIHPCLVPFDQLPADQRAKDELVHAIVGVLL